jgi:hypothetical protein
VVVVVVVVVEILYFEGQAMKLFAPKDEDTMIL